MPAIDRETSDYEVLITGFGPFATFAHNPSWLSIKDLHDTYLSTEQRPQPSSSDSSLKGEKEGKEKEDEESKEEKNEPKSPRIHIQTVQCSVSYAHVLSLIPLIHGVNPSAPEARVHLDPKGDQPDSETQTGSQGNGSPFPEGYPIQLPAKGRFDLVMHIGVGSKGAIVVERLGHKRGYQIVDVEGKKPPIATNQMPEKGQEYSEAAQRELARQGPDSSSEKKQDVIRGFGKGYEEFQDEEVTGNDVIGLIEWLQSECNFKQTRISHDAGRYLCDFIYYCSLCETKRRGAGTKVQFIHVPPTDQPQSTDDCKETIQNIVWWLICRDSRKK